MHGHDGTSLWRDRRFDLCYIDIPCSRIRVNEHRSSTRQPDRFRRREEGVGRGNNFIVRAKSQGEKRQQQCVGARVDSHGLPHVHIGGEFFFKLHQLRTEHVTAALQHVKDGLINLGLQVVVLPDMAIEPDSRFWHPEPPFEYFPTRRTSSCLLKRFSRWQMDWQDFVTLCAIFAKRKNLIPKNQKTATRGRLGQLRQVTNFSETASKNRLQPQDHRPCRPSLPTQSPVPRSERFGPHLLSDRGGQHDRCAVPFDWDSTESQSESAWSSNSAG